MPRINITEVDLTSPGQLSLLSNVVYVPGFAKRLPKEFNYKPMLFTTLNDFQSAFTDGDDLLPVRIDTADSSGSDIKYDSGFIYACELLRLGTPVLYDPLYEKSDVNEVKDAGNNITEYTPKTGTLTRTFKDGETTKTEQYIVHTTSNAKYIIAKRLSTSELCEKGTYNIKFLCTGGYTDNKGETGLATALIGIAHSRGDCVAVVDHAKDLTNERSASGDTVRAWVTTLSNALGEGQDKYGTLFTPWAIYEPTTLLTAEVVKNCELPASFGYLLAMASSSKNNPDWLAVAGANRGGVPVIKKLINPVSEALADGDSANGGSDSLVYSTRNGVAINPIMNINPFGIIIWGNRTLYDCSGKGNLVASSFLNIRNLCSNVKKTIWTAARNMTFEQNNDILWVKFKSLITPTLDQMVSGGGLAGYELKKRVAKQKATLSAVIRLYAIEAVEDFELEVQLADDSTAIIE